ncbi:MAG: Rieske 2Fe-2S domain-containing protein [Egibacteraceae bacterium]
MSGADEPRSWTPVLEFDELWEGDLTGVEVGATKVLLVNIDGEVRAYENRCPHQAWPLDQGDLDCGTLTCANHLWEFDALTGKGINPGDCALTSFPCKVDDDGMICVAVP